jgi:Fe2+ or Zn2+ uptake regulation protein
MDHIHPPHSSEDRLEKWLKTLRDSGNKVTKQRRLLLECLNQATEPLSARDIMRNTEGDSQTDTLDQVTVYRILETFREIGLVHQVFPSGGYLLCDHLGCSHGVHVMLHCSSCQKHEEVEIPKEIFGPMEWYLKKQQKFTPEKHLFQMDGTCGVCAAKNDKGV